MGGGGGRPYQGMGDPSLRGRRALVVDDNGTNREILRRQMGSWQMEVEAVGEPEEALERLGRGERYDVAVLDMQMPGMDGVGLAAEMRAIGVGMPLILLTSLGDREVRTRAGEFASVLVKPVRASALFDALVSAVTVVPGVIAQPRDEPAFDAALGRSHPLRILVAEDNATNRRLVVAILGRLGYEADVVENGVEAIQAVEAGGYDVVLMDVQMPEIDGLEATRHIRQVVVGEKQPRIVAMTANAMQGDRELCLAAGMDDYVSKPIRVEELVRALRAVTPRTEGWSEKQVSRTAVTASRGVVAPVIELGDLSLEPGGLARLLNVVGGEFADLAELIEGFLVDGPGLVAALRGSLAVGDGEATRRHAHSLKANAADFGARVLAELCQGLEVAARDGRLGDVEGIGEAIDAAYAALEEELRRILARGTLVG